MPMMMTAAITPPMSHQLTTPPFSGGVVVGGVVVFGGVVVGGVVVVGGGSGGNETQSTDNPDYGRGEYDGKRPVEVTVFSLGTEKRCRFETGNGTKTFLGCILPASDPGDNSHNIREQNKRDEYRIELIAPRGIIQYKQNESHQCQAHAQAQSKTRYAIEVRLSGKKYGKKSVTG